jgi:hypothetical protein
MRSGSAAARPEISLTLRFSVLVEQSQPVHGQDDGSLFDASLAMVFASLFLIDRITSSLAIIFAIIFDILFALSLSSLL